MKMTISPNVLALTSEELEQAYRLREHNYRLQDAERQFVEDYLGIHDRAPEPGSYDAEEIRIISERFRDAYGFCWIEAIDPSSDHYLLEDFVEQFEEIFNCNVTENDLWQEAIWDVLAKLTKK